jgi:hypothetical protein
MTALFAAFSLQDKIEQYGAYAGIAAVFGLGVLSLLYFAQAREVKRLRTWAGRAPERAAELEARVQADAQRRAAAAQQPPRPAAPVTPAAQQQAPATGAAAPATAAAAAAGAGATTVTKPATPGQPEAKPPTPEIPAAATAAAAGAAARPQPAAPLRAPTPAASLPPRTPAGARPGTTGDGRSRGRLAAIVGGALGAVAVIVVVAILLFGGGGGKKQPPAPNTVAQPGATTSAGGNATPATPAAKLVRKDFPLAVLNGTTVTGLARGAADKLTAKGYNEPNVVTNDTTNQARDTTEIFFEPKARAAALDVAKILGVKAASVKPMDANARALADRATVAVFVGADKAQ